MTDVVINTAKKTIIGLEEAPIHLDNSLPLFEGLSDREYATTLLLIICETCGRCFPPEYDTRRKRSRLLLHLSDSNLLSIINSTYEDGRKLISSYTALGDRNVLRSNAYAPVCSNTQMYNPDMIVKYLAGIRDDNNVREMLNIYCGRVFHESSDLDKIFDYALDENHWDRTKLFFSTPNALPRLCRKLELKLIYHPIEINERPLSEYPDPVDMDPPKTPVTTSASNHANAIGQSHLTQRDTDNLAHDTSPKPALPNDPHACPTVPHANHPAYCTHSVTSPRPQLIEMDEVSTLTLAKTCNSSDDDEATTAPSVATQDKHALVQKEVFSPPDEPSITANVSVCDTISTSQPTKRRSRRLSNRHLATKTPRSVRDTRSSIGVDRQGGD